MEVIIRPTAEDASIIGARMVARLLRENPDSVLGLATGSTPIGLYKELIRMHREDSLDFSKVKTFNLDEYIGLSPVHPQSYRRFMDETLFRWIGIPVANIHFPDGTAKDIPTSCTRYEEEIRSAGGIDMQILGIGSDGHIAFNEPTSSLTSRTRIKTLTEQTRKDNARFFDHEDDVPHHVITMGLGTIMEARMCLLLAFGKGKAQAVAEMVEGPLTSMIPASVLQLHPSTKVLLDEDAASALKKAAYYRWVYDHKPEWQRF